jgi:hypothetical protein
LPKAIHPIFLSRISILQHLHHSFLVSDRHTPSFRLQLRRQYSENFVRLLMYRYRDNEFDIISSSELNFCC